ncbi:hypothetical protein N7470_010214 [Penicillium chermesinum]|nr:hypothetical protein N7470_010214 [Penicillium chermesinum]
MASKRKASMSPPSEKRARIDEDDGSEPPVEPLVETSRPDPLYGQRNAFPGLTDENEELSYDDQMDAFEYLRMVRSEANTVPSLLSAPSTNPSTSQMVSESVQKGPRIDALPTGFYDDEAYIAPVDINRDDAPTDPTYPEAQISYYTLLHHRFILLRSTLKCSPPATTIANLDESHPISLPPRVGAARKEWRRLVMSVDPHMAQLACMDPGVCWGCSISSLE